MAIFPLRFFVLFIHEFLQWNRHAIVHSKRCAVLTLLMGKESRCTNPERHGWPDKSASRGGIIINSMGNTTLIDFHLGRENFT